VENECTSHNIGVFAIFFTILTIGGNLARVLTKIIYTVSETRCKSCDHLHLVGMAVYSGYLANVD